MLTDYTQDEKALKGACDCSQGTVVSQLYTNPHCCLCHKVEFFSACFSFGSTFQLRHLSLTFGMSFCTFLSFTFLLLFKPSVKSKYLRLKYVFYVVQPVI